MTLGLAPRQTELLDPVTRLCAEQVDAGSIFGLLHRERDNLFPDELFADLFSDRGRRSVPPSILACVMVLQKLGGLSDAEAVDRFTYDARWRYACGVGGWDDERLVGFGRTVLVYFRARLRDSADPDRIMRVTTQVATEAGLVGLRRALDSAPLYDAVATQDTVTLIRSAIRGLLRACPPELAAAVRAVLARDDDYAAAGKPVCDWDDAEARERLVDELVGDGMAALLVVEGREVDDRVAEAAALLATVVGQDVEQGEDGVFRIARRVAADRVISTVDPDARHGRKTAARSFDGYKGHVAIDPDSEIITAATVTPANEGDADATDTLLAEFTPDHHDSDGRAADSDGRAADSDSDASSSSSSDGIGGSDDGGDDDAGGDGRSGPIVYGDAAYGSGANLERLEGMGATAMTKVPPATAPGGRFTKDDFDIDTHAHTVGCPGGHRASYQPRRDGSGEVRFGSVCADCPLRAQCTTAKDGRTVKIGPREALLAKHRARQQDPGWTADYNAHRPKVERKLAHLLRRRHGGRRARVIGLKRVAQDWDLNAAAHNLARLAVLGIRRTATGWHVVAA